MEAVLPQSSPLQVISGEDSLTKQYFLQLCEKLRECEEVFKTHPELLFDGPEEFYTGILKFAKVIYGNLSAFGYKRREFVDLVLEMGEIKEEIDDSKDYANDLADTEVYSTVGRVEAITERQKLKKYLRS